MNTEQPTTPTPAGSKGDANTNAPTPSAVDTLLARLRAINRGKNADPKHRRTRGAFGRSRHNAHKPQSQSV